MERSRPLEPEWAGDVYRSDLVLGRLKQLQTRYPRLICDVRARELVVDIEFYLVDIAIDASHTLLDAGITAVHRMTSPRILSLQLPSLLEQHQEQLAIDHLDRFLRMWARGGLESVPPVAERR
jgi:hypothetical protein